MFDSWLSNHFKTQLSSNITMALKSELASVSFMWIWNALIALCPALQNTPVNNTTYNRVLKQGTSQTEIGAFRTASNASKRIKSDAEEQPVVLFVLAMERCAISKSSFVVSRET